MGRIAARISSSTASMASVESDASRLSFICGSREAPQRMFTQTDWTPLTA